MAKENFSGLLANDRTALKSTGKKWCGNVQNRLSWLRFCREEPWEERVFKMPLILGQLSN